MTIAVHANKHYNDWEKIYRQLANELKNEVLYTTMRTKRIFIYTLLSSLILCLSSCESPLQTIVGEYSFKISGQVTKDGNQGIVLPDEIGAMEIIHLADSNYLLTFNTINGSAYTTQATKTGNQLDLQPFSRIVTLTYYTQESDILGGLIEITETEHFDTDIYGYGTIYDKTIEFKLQYSGEELTSSKRIKGNNITMLAKKN